MNTLKKIGKFDHDFFERLDIALIVLCPLDNIEWNCVNRYKLQN